LHSFGNFGISALHEVHNGFFELIAFDTLIDKQLVFNLGLFDEHIDHHGHLVHLATLSSLTLQLH